MPPSHQSSLTDAFLILAPALGAIYLAIAAAILLNVNPHGAAFYSGIAVLVIGSCTLVKSKWDKIKLGKLFIWGPPPARAKMKLLFFGGYALMVAGWYTIYFSGSL